MNYSIEFPITVERVDENQMRITFSTTDDRSIFLEGADIDAVREAVQRGGGWLHAQSEYQATIRREGPVYTFKVGQ
jgi:hypothetical protein